MDTKSYMNGEKDFNQFHNRPERNILVVLDSYREWFVTLRRPDNRDFLNTSSNSPVSSQRKFEGSVHRSSNNVFPDIY